MSGLTLYRPVGTGELIRINELRWDEFPPRPPEQPIFYPVLELAYARQIARDCYSRRETDQRGYVTRFVVFDEFAKGYEPRVVCSAEHLELWARGEDLPILNANISGKIELVEEFLNGAQVPLGFDRPEFLILDHRARVRASDDICACYYCLETFPSGMITRWIDDSANALCPRREVDAILQTSQGHPVADRAYLKPWQERAFGHG